MGNRGEQASEGTRLEAWGPEPATSASLVNARGSEGLGGPGSTRVRTWVRGRGKCPGSERVSRAGSWVVRCRVREQEGPRAWTASDAERGPRSRASGAGRRRTVGAARNSPARRTGVPRGSKSDSRVEVLLGKELVGQGLGSWLAAPAPHSAPLPAAPQSAQFPLPVPAACSSSSSRFLLRSRSPMAGPEVSAGLSPATSVLSTPGRPWSGVSLAA